VPLAPKTLARILAGARKFNWPAALIALLAAEIERSMIHAIRHHLARRHLAPAAIQMRHRARALQNVAALRALRQAPAAAGLDEHGTAAEPMVVTLRNHADGKAIGAPLPTIAAAGGHIGIATPIVMATGQAPARSDAEPLPTITTGGAGNAGRPGCARPMLVEPFVLSQASGGAPRAVSDPIPTAATGGAIALVAPYYGSGSGETCRSVESPMPTATAKARFGMVVPITHSCGANRARDAECDPLPTLTTAHRGELALVESTAQLDILFRMFEPHELAAAMGFESGDVPYAFAGTKTDKVKQIGNAVSVRLMRACVTAALRRRSEVVVAA
jgi:DNA (cytosine-5)-methyltransferase 1